MKIIIQLLLISCLVALAQCAVHKEQILNQTVTELDGKRFLQQRIVIFEYPRLETELRVTEIP